MAHGFGGPSKYLIKNVKKYFTIYLVRFTGVVIFIYLVFSYFADPYWKTNKPIWLTLLGLYVFSLYWVSVFLKKSMYSNFWFRGAKGESSVRDLLELFPKEYAYFRGLAVEGTNYDIDYVLVGPKGVYTIEVKSHYGDIGFQNGNLVRNGQMLDKNFIQQSLNQALYVHNFLLRQLRADIFVTPVIVFSNNVKLSFGLNKVENVYVIQKNWLGKLLESRSDFRYPFDRRLIENELKKLVKNPE